MRELRVEDALLYLDQVKVEFGDRPHIYNEFLDIMKTFKTQQIDTPGVIRRVSNLFQGNRRLVLGFNTFLPEGYKIELPLDGDGPPVAVFRAPGSSVTHVLSSSGPGPQATAAMGQHHEQQRLQQQREQQQRDKQQQQQQQQQQSGPPGAAARAGMPPHAQAPGPPPPTGRRGPPPQGTQQSQQQQQHQQQQHSRDSSQGEMPTMPTQHSQAGGPGGPAPARGQQSQQQQMQQSQQQQQPPQGMPRDGAARAQYPMESQQQPARGGGPGLGGPPPHHSAAEAAASQAPRQPQAPAPAPGRPQEGSAANVAAQRMAAPNAMGSMPPAAAAQQPQQHSPPTQQQQPPAPAARSPEVHQPAPLEFDHAINYVTTIKKRFSSEPETYKRFLEILHTYQKEQRGIKEVLDEVSTLFADHPDLLKEFTYFLPDAVQGQAKAQLDQVAKESEARKRTQAKQAIMTTAQGMQRQAQGLTRAPASASRGPEYERSTAPVPFGATQGRSLDRERDIIRGAHFGVVSFAPVRPPKRNESTPAQAAAKKGRPTAIPELPRLPNTTETVFFQRAKDHLNRKELAADKAPGSRRHTPYTEFIKCLHLFGSGILNKDELVLLLRGLFMQGHAPKSGANAGGGVSNPSVANDAGELLRELEEILVGRGPYADQENALKDKSKYGGLRARDFDLSNCETPTPSYRTYPTDFPQSLFLSNPGQTESDAANLNKTLICVGPEKNTKKRLPRSLEAYDGVRMRHNMYEESLFRIEDERYEVDMAIERNAQAMRQIEPFAEEVQALREQEEKDGQPIGRLQYQLNRYALNSVHINAIGRLFGEYGDEVLQHLCRNPIIVLPIVYERLKQKDTEWRKAKEDLTEKWNAGFIANYEGSKDVLCYPYRRELERNFAPKLLLEECKRARIHCKHPEKIRDHPATRNFTPTFSPGSSDRGSLLFQPYLQVGAKVDISHKDAFNFVVRQLTSTSKVSPLDRERIGRIWAEFIVPWFGYPLHWVRDEVRSSFRGKLTPAVVKMASGQRVMTIYGAGTVASFLEKDAWGKAKYRIKLPFAVAYVGPSAILYAIPSKDAPFVRRDGVMMRDDSVVENGGSIGKLDQKYKLLFGTESVYVFLRLYSLLCSILSSIREHCESFERVENPASSYYNPVPKETNEADAKRLDYVAALQKVLAKKMDLKDFESLGRKVSKEKVHEMAALPKLIERCSDALLKVSKEDALLHLYDFCQNQEIDPVAARTRCLGFATDAVYRIQYNTSDGVLCFSHLPKNEELLTTPIDDIQEVVEDEIMNGKADPMEEEETDPIEEYAESNVPAAKRTKLR